jgi:transcriptional regulator with XRE-family HTH domain
VVPVSTPLGDFLRARRDATSPDSLGLPAGPRRRVPGLRRSELASLAGISVEYLVRIEQGRDRNPSISVVNALADALRLDVDERGQLRNLAKRASNQCFGGVPQPQIDVRPSIRAILDQLEPGIALITNRLGNILAYTSGFELLARPTGLLDEPRPNITRFVFTDDRARELFPDWEHIADEQSFDLWLSSCEESERLLDEITALAGTELTECLQHHRPRPSGPQAWHHPDLGELRFEREVLELPAADGQQLVVLLPADADTADAVNRMSRTATRTLRAVN